MPDHARDGAPTLALGKRAAECEPGALDIGIVLVHGTPVVRLELTESEPLSVDSARATDIGTPGVRENQ